MALWLSISPCVLQAFSRPFQKKWHTRLLPGAHEYFYYIKFTTTCSIRSRLTCRLAYYHPVICPFNAMTSLSRCGMLSHQALIFFCLSLYHPSIARSSTSLRVQCGSLRSVALGAIQQFSIGARSGLWAWLKYYVIPLATFHLVMGEFCPLLCLDALSSSRTQSFSHWLTSSFNISRYTAIVIAPLLFSAS